MNVTPIRPDVKINLSADDGQTCALEILHVIRIEKLKQPNGASVSNIHGLYEALSYGRYNWLDECEKSVKIEVACDCTSDVTIPHVSSSAMKAFYYAITLGRIFEVNALHKYSRMLRGEYSLDQLITDYSTAFANTLLTELN